MYSIPAGFALSTISICRLYVDVSIVCVTFYDFQHNYIYDLYHQYPARLFDKPSKIA